MDTILTPSERDLPARQRILVAAAQVFAEQGYTGATTRRIAARAGVNEVTIFRQFGSKQNLLAEAVALAASLPGMEYGLADGRSTDLHGELLRMARRYLERMIEQRGLLLMTISAAARLPAAGQALGLATLRQQQVLAGYLRQKLDPDSAASLDVEDAARHLLEMLLASALTYDLAPDPHLPPPPEKLAAAIVDFFLRALEGKGKAGPASQQLRFDWS
jgi:AcrR family transcriptional regulator